MRRQQAQPDANLRKRAEERVSQVDRPVADRETEDLKRLLHELEVHQVELRMQNEELKAARSAMEQSRSRYVDLYDFAPVGYFTFTQKGLIKEINLTGAAMLGVDRKLLLNRPFSFFATPAGRDVFWKHYQDVLRTGEKQRCELQLKTRAGTVLWVVMKSVPGRSEEDAATVRSVFLDITERKQAETKLKEANTKLKKAVMEQKRTADALVKVQAAIEQAREAVIITDESWNIEYANHSASMLTGYEQGELIGVNAWTLRDPADGRTIVEGPLPGISQRGICAGQYTIRRKDGTTVQVEGDSAPVDDKNGAARSCVLVLRDITERKRLERELRQAQKMEAVGTFAAGIAHDFNNILAGIVGFTEMVLEDMDPGDPGRARLSLVLKGANRGRDLVRQILAFGRAGESSGTSLSLGEVVSEAYSLLRASIPSTVDIRVSIKAKGDTIVGDQTQIHQMLMSLGSNAAYAMREKGGVLEISLSDVKRESKEAERLHAIKPGMWLKLTVRDTGSGIDPEVIDRIFDPFFTTKGPGEGTGMGLAVVHGIMRDHGGDITVASEPGKGSTFHLFFPSIVADPTDNVIKEAAVHSGNASILFVDDEELLVEMNRTRLGRLGYKITATTDSEEALKLFRDDPAKFDLLITDYTMPHLTGIDLAREVLRIRGDLPVILCTGFGEESVVQAARAAGIGGFLSKPITVREIASTIATLLEKKGVAPGT